MPSRTDRRAHLMPGSEAEARDRLNAYLNGQPFPFPYPRRRQPAGLQAIRVATRDFYVEFDGRRSKRLVIKVPGE